MAIKVPKGLTNVTKMEKSSKLGTALKVGEKILSSLAGGGESNPKSNAKGPNFGLNFGFNSGNKSEDKSENIVFVKNDYRPEKTERKNIFKRLVKETNLANEIQMTNEDIVTSLYNINEVQKLNPKLPRVNTKLFKDMLLNWKKPKIEDSKTEAQKLATMQELSATQERIYKILFKIEDELIDEQDTTIKENANRKADQEEFLKRLQEILKENNLALKDLAKEEEGGEDGFGVLDALNMLDFVKKPLNRLYNKVANSVKQATAKGLKTISKYVGKAKGKITSALNLSETKVAKAVKENFSKLGNSMKNAGTALKQLGAKGANAAGKLVGASGKALSKTGAKIAQLITKTALKMLGKVVPWIALIQIIYYLVSFWIEADKAIDEPGIIEKIIFTLTAAFSQWVMDFIDIIKLLFDFLVWLCDCLYSAGNAIAEFLPDGCKGVAKKVIGLLHDYSPWKLIKEYIVDPVVKWINDKKLYGAGLGVQAVQIYRECKEEFIRLIPNTSTLKMLFGSDEDLEAVKKSGIYTYNRLGNSTVNVENAEDLAKLATTSELQKILEHDDISSSDREKVKKALEIRKSQNMSDAETKNNRSNDKLQQIVSSLNNGGITKVANLIGIQGAKLWLRWAKLALSSINKSAPACMLEYHKNPDGSDGTLCYKILYDDDWTHFSDNEWTYPKNMLNAFMFYFNKNKISFKIEGNIWMTPYGTIFIETFINDILETEKYIGNASKLKLQSNGTLGKAFKVIGYFDVNTGFKEKEFCPGDKCVDEYCTQNILTKEVTPTFGEAKAVNDTTEIDSFIRNSPDDYANPIVNSTVPAAAINTGSSGIQSLPPILDAKPISKSEASDKVWKFLTSKLNLTDFQAAGIMGNLDVECGGFNSKYITGCHWDVNGPSGGMCQWHDKGQYGGRLTKLKKFAESIGKPWGDVETQLLYLEKELNSSESKALREVRKATTVEEAARAWVYYFERPANKEFETIKRGNIGKKYLEQYGSLTESTEVSNTSSSSPSDLESATETVLNPSGNSNIENATETVVNASESAIESVSSASEKDTGETTGESKNGISADDVKPSGSISDMLNIGAKLIAGTTYSQPNRFRKGFFDCSSFVGTTLIQSGLKYPSSLPSTATMGNSLAKAGYSYIGKTNSKNVKELKPGDILLYPRKHVMLYAGNGEVLEANGYKGSHNGKNRWGSLHNKSDLYQVWRLGGGTPISALSEESNDTLAEASSTRAQQNMGDPNRFVEGTKQSSENGENVLLADGNNNTGPSPYDGQAEELFSIKYAEVLV